MLTLSRGTSSIFLAAPLAAAILLVAGYAVAAAPSYLSSMPPVKRVLSEVRGRDALDTAARQCGVFDQLISMIGVFEGPRQFSLNKQSPDEIRLRRAYISAENKIAASVKQQLSHVKTSATGLNTPWAKWLNARHAYSEDTGYVLNKFFPVQWQREYHVAAQQEKEASAAGERSLSRNSQNSAAVTYGLGGKASSSGHSAMLQLIVWAILLAPVVFLLSRIRLNRNATKLTSGFRRWKLTNITGRVTSYRSHTSVHGGGGYSGPVHISSDLYENLRLELRGGEQWDIELENFNLSPQIGDVITICLGSRRGSQRTLAALNHTTKSQAVNAQHIFAMGTGGSLLQSLKILAMLFFMVLCLVLGIFGNQPAIVLWGLVPFGVWLLRTLFIRAFANNGTNPLWDATAVDAQEFVRPSAAPAD